MFYIVSYDMPDDKKRLKMANTLLDFGTRVQYSVFECIMDDKLIKKMMAKISKIISEEDSVRIYGLCAKCEKVITVLGRGDLTKDQDVFIL